MKKHYFGIVCALASLALVTGCANENPEELEDQLAAVEEGEALGDMGPDLDAEWIGTGICAVFVEGWGLGFGKPILSLGAYGIGYPGFGFYPDFGCGCGVGGGAVATTTTVVAGGGCVF